jgi:hypothetical protein
MYNTYQIINQVVTPEKLQAIAYEAQVKSQRRRGKEAREPSVAPSHTARLRSLSRARVDKKVHQSPNLESIQPSVVQSGITSVSHTNAMSSTNARSLSPIILASTDRAIANGHDNASVYIYEWLYSINCSMKVDQP